MEGKHENKAMNENTENSSGRRMSLWRVVAWGAAAFILLLPMVAMQFTDEVNWTASDFVFAGVLLFGSLGAYELAARRTDNATYQFGVGMAITAAFLLTWINAAVGITDSPADGMYLGVVAMGIIGAVIARFRPVGMTYAMLAAALALVVVGTVALSAGMVPAYNSAFEILGLTGFFAALFVGSAWLFWEAAGEQPLTDAGGGG
jgi:hypothetical protein